MFYGWDQRTDETNLDAHNALGNILSALEIKIQMPFDFKI